MADEYIPSLLPLSIELETKEILKKVISANRALAELKGVANSIPQSAHLDQCPLFARSQRLFGN